MDDLARKQNTQKLNAIVAADSQTLFTFYAVFPFDLFPDKISIDRDKITITRRFFFFDRATQSVLVKDLMTVVVEETLLFASLRFVERLVPHQSIVVMHLPKGMARRARRIIEGLIVSDKKGIELSSIPNRELVPKLIEIGKVIA